MSLAAVLAGGVVIGGLLQRHNCQEAPRRQRPPVSATALGSDISTLPAETYATSGTVTAMPEIDAPADEGPLPFPIVTSESGNGEPSEEDPEEADEADEETDDEPTMEEVVIPAEEEIVEEDPAEVIDEPVNGAAGDCDRGQVQPFLE